MIEVSSSKVFIATGEETTSKVTISRGQEVKNFSVNFVLQLIGDVTEVTVIVFPIYATNFLVRLSRGAGLRGVLEAVISIRRIEIENL